MYSLTFSQKLCTFYVQGMMLIGKMKQIRFHVCTNYLIKLQARM